MELRHLRYFVAVAEELHFGWAAQRLHIVQPALSKQISSLEQELGVRLFERTKRHVQLTEAGAVLLDDARHILAQADTAVQRAHQVSRGDIGSLTVGFIAPVLWELLPRLLRRYRAHYPGVRLFLKELHNVEALDGVLGKQLDVAFPLRRKKLSKAERREVVEHAVESVGLASSIDKYPWQLSGGMQQRVAIARALAYRPELLLMDEPFASVDAQTRFELEDMILQIRDDFGVTVVLVTHDIDEAVYLADRVVVLSQAPSSVKQLVDIPLERPRNQAHTRNDPQFAHLRTYILELVTGG